MDEKQKKRFEEWWEKDCRFYDKHDRDLCLAAWEVQRVMVCESGGNRMLTIDELGYVEEMRQRLGLDPDDTSRDKEIESMSPMDRIRLLAGWFHGDSDWAGEWKHYFESQGLYLTTNPEADGVLE